MSSEKYIDSLVQNCSKSNAKALDLLQSFTKQSIYRFANDVTILGHWTVVVTTVAPLTNMD